MEESRIYWILKILVLYCRWQTWRSEKPEIFQVFIEKAENELLEALKKAEEVL